MRILWTPQAIADAGALPEAVLKRVGTKIGILAEFPLMGPAMDGPYEGFRQLVIDRHRVVYRVDGEEVWLAYIRHGARQIGLRLIRGGK